MKKIVIHRPGGYERLKIEEHPDLIAKPGEVIVEARGMGVNYADCCVRWGVYESAKKFVGWPITPGFEFAGRVKSIGSGVTKFHVGDSVFGITLFNGYSTQIAVTEDLIFALPKGLKFEEAAGFPAVYMTAYHALHQLVRIRKGGTVLIHSAAGGVGTALLQLCRIEGLRTIAVVRGHHKIETAKEFGADVVIDKGSQDLWKEVELAAPHGLDAVFDANGFETLQKGYEHLAPTGKLIVYGAHNLLPKTGGKLNFFKLITGYLKIPKYNPMKLISDNKSVVGFNISFLFMRKDLLTEGMTQLLKWLDEGKIIPPKITLFPMTDVALAHKSIESGQSVGKLILVSERRTD